MTVSLADGSTQGFRMKSPGRTLLAQPGQETSWILPLGGMARVGFKVEWLEDEWYEKMPCMASKEEGGKALRVWEECRFGGFGWFHGPGCFALWA